MTAFSIIQMAMALVALATMCSLQAHAFVDYGQCHSERLRLLNQLIRSPVNVTTKSFTFRNYIYRPPTPDECPKVNGLNKYRCMIEGLCARNKSLLNFSPQEGFIPADDTVFPMIEQMVPGFYDMCARTDFSRINWERFYTQPYCVDYFKAEDNKYYLISSGGLDMQSVTGMFPAENQSLSDFLEEARTKAEQRCSSGLQFYFGFAANMTEIAEIPESVVPNTNDQDQTMGMLTTIIDNDTFVALLERTGGVQLLNLTHPWEEQLDAKSVYSKYFTFNLGAQDLLAGEGQALTLDKALRPGFYFPLAPDQVYGPARQCFVRRGYQNASSPSLMTVDELSSSGNLCQTDSDCWGPGMTSQPVFCSAENPHYCSRCEYLFDQGVSACVCDTTQFATLSSEPEIVRPTQVDLEQYQEAQVAMQNYYASLAKTPARSVLRNYKYFSLFRPEGFDFHQLSMLQTFAFGFTPHLSSDLRTIPGSPYFAANGPLGIAGSYLCGCDTVEHSMISMSSGSLTCVDDRNECDEGIHSCGEHSLCVNRRQGYDCECLPGYVYSMTPFVRTLRDSSDLVNATFPNSLEKFGCVPINITVSTSPREFRIYTPRFQERTLLRVTIFGLSSLYDTTPTLLGKFPQLAVVEAGQTEQEATYSPELVEEDIVPNGLYHVRLERVVLNPSFVGNVYSLFPSDVEILAPSVPPFVFDRIVQLKCGCDNTSTAGAFEAYNDGAPRNLTVDQDQGKMQLSFDDDSVCEQSFTIIRYVTSASDIDPDTSPAVNFTQFAQPIDFASEGCGARVPLPILDDITRVAKVGEYVHYCVQATAEATPNVLEYRSSRSCIVSKVKFESRLIVTIINPITKEPVPNATVRWESEHLVPGSALTDSGGGAVLNLISSTFVGEFLTVRISVDKTSLADDPLDPLIVHRFTCVGSQFSTSIFCDEIPVLLAPFGEQTLEVNEVTPVTVSGRVVMDRTQTATKPSGCGLAGARVCLRTTTDQEECAETDANGFYRVDGKADSRVKMSVSLPRAAQRGNTTFSFIREPHPALNGSEEYFFLRTSKGYSNLNFLDVASVETLYVHVAGGMCLLEFLQSLQVQFLVCEDNFQTLSMIKVEGNLFQGQVPAGLLSNVKIVAAEAIGATTTQNNEILASFANTAQTIDLRVLTEANATSEDGLFQRTAFFVYHPASTVNVEFFDFGPLDTAQDPVANMSDEDSWKTVDSRYLIGQGNTCNSGLPFGCQQFIDPTRGVRIDWIPFKIFGAQVKFSARFPNGATCPVVPDVEDVIIEDRLADPIPELPSPCTPSCTRPIEYVDAMNASVVRYLFRVNPTDVAPHLRTFKVTLGSATASYCWRIVGAVEGARNVTAQPMVIPMVPDAPLLVLRDPPGSKSFQYARNVETFASLKLNVGHGSPSTTERHVTGGGAEFLIDDPREHKSEDQNKPKPKTVKKPVNAAVASILKTDREKLSKLKKALDGLKAQARIPSIKSSLNAIRKGLRSAGNLLKGTLVKLLSGLLDGQLCIGVGFFASAKACKQLFKAHAGGSGGSSNTKTIVKSVDTPGETDIAGSGTLSDYHFRWSMQTDRNEGIPGDDMFMLLMTEMVVTTITVVEASGPCGAGLDTVLAYRSRPMSKPLPGLNNGERDNPGFMWVSRRHLHESTFPILDKVIDDNTARMADRQLANQTLQNLLKILSDTDANDDQALQTEVDNFFVLPNGFLSNGKVSIGAQTIAEVTSADPFYTIGRQPFSSFTGVPANTALEEKVKKSNFISFYGGGSVLEYTFEAERFAELNSEEETRGLTQPNNARTESFDINVLAQFRYFFENFNAESEITGATVTTWTRHVQSSDVGFVLADSTVGDAFNVQIYMDKKYRSFGFKTLFGRSTCPHEPNTDQREKPLLHFPHINATEVHPGVPAEFYAELRNVGDDAASFELYVDTLALNGNDVKVLVNGKNIVGLPLTFDEIPAKGQIPVKVQVIQGQALADSMPLAHVVIGLRSKCESSSFNPLLRGRRSVKPKRQAPFMRAGDAITDEQELYIDFLRHCPRLEWAGEFAKPDSAIVIRSAPEGTQTVMVAVRNRGSKRWMDLPQVLSVRIQYRLRSASTQSVSDWSFVTDPAIVDLVPLESNQTHFAAYSWDVSSINEDAVVELRIIVDCAKPTPKSGLANEPGIAYFVTDVKSFRIDRSRPRLFSSIPNDGGKIPLGQPIMMDFDESLRCNSIVAEMHIEAMSTVLTSGQELMVLCKLNQLQVQMDRSRVELRQFAGQQARVVVTSIMDVAGNLLNAGGFNATGQMDILVEFDQAKGRDYSITGLLLDDISDIGNGIYVPFTPVYDEVTANITATVASLVGVTVDRVKVDSFVFVSSNRVRVDLYLFAASAPPVEPGRRRLASSDEDLGALIEALVANNTLTLDQDGKFDVEASASSPNGVTPNGEVNLAVNSNAQVVIDSVSEFQGQVSDALKQTFEESQVEFNRIQESLEDGVENVIEKVQAILSSILQNTEGGRRRLVASSPVSVRGAAVASVESQEFYSAWNVLFGVGLLIIGIALGRWMK